MTDKQRGKQQRVCVTDTTLIASAAVLALALVSQSCTDALAAIGPNSPDSTPLHLILADVDALLALIYNIATKLALALKPAAPAYSAATPLLDDLANHPPALAHCTRLLHDDIHGAALSKDLRSRAKEIIGALRALVQTFLNNAAHGPQLTSTGAAGEEYLVRTATLHDLVTDARSPSGIPKDNQAAVYRAWKSDRESLEDNLQEIATMIKHAQSDDESDQLDDGWDDIGLAPSTNMDEHELARANNVSYLSTSQYLPVLSPPPGPSAPAPHHPFPQAHLSRSPRTPLLRTRLCVRLPPRAVQPTPLHFRRSRRRPLHTTRHCLRSRTDPRARQDHHLAPNTVARLPPRHR